MERLIVRKGTRHHNPRQDAADYLSKNRLGIGLLAASVSGIVLTGAILPRFGRAGGLLQQLGTGILFGRALQFTASGVPKRQRLIPRTLTYVETVADGLATATGLWAWIARPLLGRISRSRDQGGKKAATRAATGEVTEMVRVSRALALLSFVLHTLRMIIYITPNRGLRRVTEQEPR